MTGKELLGMALMALVCATVLTLGREGGTFAPATAVAAICGGDNDPDGGGGGGEGNEGGGGGGGGSDIVGPGPGPDSSSRAFKADDCTSKDPVPEPVVIPEPPQGPPAGGDAPGGGNTQTGTVLGAGTLPPPVLGVSFNLEPLAGSVYVSLPGSQAGARPAGYVSPLRGRRFIPLSEARQVPIGSILDLRTGIARLTTASSVAGQVFKGKFAVGVVQVLQSANPALGGLTDLSMRGGSFRNCDTGASRATAMAARKSKRRVRGLRGNAKGRFRSSGRYSAATVRGTRWAITDYCFGTLTRVKRGQVDVRDFVRRKTVRVRPGRIYVARP